jgi:Asp-tRNA(Asn)/Glu-tRNA(Gln) amidotransferase A subunit family amidase
MIQKTSRRRFIGRTGGLAAGSLIGSTLVACATTPAAPTAAQQIAMDSTQALAAMRSGRMSAESYVGTMLARADQLADLHALISVDREGALAAARRIDAMRASGAALPVLAGLPIVVKDNINTRDLPTTGGTPALHNVRPKANAPSLQKLIDAGAIVIGKSNMHELAFGITSTNLSPFAGAVRNPYDRSRIPGGSSGGTAVAIASRIVTSGLGTDTGGSTRVPASLCGVVGLRPSVGNGGAERRYTDTNAVVPISHTRDTIGPMGRSVIDVALLDAAITGAPLAQPANPKGLRIGVPASFWADLDTETNRVMTAARTVLAGAGVVFVDVDTVGLAALNAKVSFQIALHEPIADIPAYLAATGVTGIDVATIAMQIASPDVKGAFGAIAADAFGGSYDEAIKVHRPRMQLLYASYFRDNALDAMMFPTTPLPAAEIDAANGSSKVSVNGGSPVDTFGAFIRNTDPGSNAGIPGISIPAGLTSGGLPVGLELDGPLGSDTRLIGVALAFEALLGPIRPPSV